MKTLATKKSKEEYFIVKGNSMLPIITPNHTIHVRKQEVYKKGDIIVFHSYRNYVVHRIVKINGHKITTKGDHNHELDAPTNAHKVVGKLYKVGRQKMDTKYWEVVNPILAKISLLGNKLALRKLMRAYSIMQWYKGKLLGNTHLHVYYTFHILLNIPFLLSQTIMRFLKKIG